MSLSVEAKPVASCGTNLGTVKVGVLNSQPVSCTLQSSCAQFIFDKDLYLRVIDTLTLHILTVHPLQGSFPSRLHLHQRCDSHSVTPLLHNLVLKMDVVSPRAQVNHRRTLFGRWCCYLPAHQLTWLQPTAAWPPAQSWIMKQGAASIPSLMIITQQVSSLPLLSTNSLTLCTLACRVSVNTLNTQGDSSVAPRGRLLSKWRCRVISGSD